MDCLEFRRTFGGDPMSREAALAEHRLACRACASFAEDVRELDGQLARAMDLPVPEGLVERVVAADQAGLDRFAVSDHVAFGADLSAYGDPSKGGTANGRQPTGPDGHWLEPLTVIAHLTALTHRVRFSTNILLAALRRPVVLAKTVATIDALSGGRIDLGVGVGWQAAEYEAAGLDFGSRGDQLDHTLAVCRTLWRDDVASFADDRLRFDEIHQMPKPSDRTVPIWVSGTVQPRAMARLARFGHGWIPWGTDAVDLPGAIGRVGTPGGGVLYTSPRPRE